MAIRTGGEKRDRASGPMVTINHRVTNMAPHATTGRAVPSLVRWRLASISKVRVLFQQPDLQAGETRDMPVTFSSTTTCPRFIEAMALSYTFFRCDE